MLPHETIVEAFKIHFEDQVLAIIRQNGQAVYAEHLEIVFRPEGYMSWDGQMRELLPQDMTATLISLMVKGKIDCAHGHPMSPKSIWKYIGRQWDEFDQLALEHIND